jgi:redox-sensitive bicupin YhaK (pirin superfamily)
LVAGRHAWVQLISGSIDLNGEVLNAGDGAAVSDESVLAIKALANDSEFLLFDLN